MAEMTRTILEGLHLPHGVAFSKEEAEAIRRKILRQIDEHKDSAARLCPGREEWLATKQKRNGNYTIPWPSLVNSTSPQPAPRTTEPLNYEPSKFNYELGEYHHL